MTDQLSNDQGKVLLRLARQTIAGALNRSNLMTGGFAATEKPAASTDQPQFLEQRGTFVTLKIKGQLRGCMGNLSASETIAEGIRRNALNAAFHDPRFPELSPAELARTDIEISILTDAEPLQYHDAADLLQKLRPMVDGVIIKKGFASATFLPQVWEQLPRPADFLTHLCRKAGLAGNAWQEGSLEVRTYQVQKFEE